MFGGAGKFPRAVDVGYIYPTLWFDKSARVLEEEERSHADIPRVARKEIMRR
jgi:hypothetical protein